jgi:hypothetical protein
VGDDAQDQCTVGSGNRYDDPAGEYRVLYAAGQRRGAFLETLARFRIDLQLVAEMDAIDGDERDDAYPTNWTIFEGHQLR